jgi:hypothetical protein
MCRRRISFQVDRLVYPLLEVRGQKLTSFLGDLHCTISILMGKQPYQSFDSPLLQTALCSEHEKKISLQCNGNTGFRHLIYNCYDNWSSQCVHVCLSYLKNRSKGHLLKDSNLRPLRGFWDVSVPHHCIDERRFEMVAAIINITVDFVIIVLPLPTIWSLQLAKRQKWALSGVFMLGTLYENFLFRVYWHFKLT